MRARISLGLVALLAAGCATELRNRQLQQVAKDWSLVIRASQVIPVYPLSEDLQPGDVLLVSTPIENQVEIYEEKGFLPLDQHLVRLYSEGSDEFYNFRYGVSEGTFPPGQWQAASATASHSWGNAPRASFPSYQFSVRTGSGLSLAIPIQGVPFALGLMNSGSASGTVTISDAYTYGLDIVRLEAAVREWSNGNRRLLRAYAPNGGQNHFLRVVNRVYVTGRVNVTMSNDEATSGELAAGADRPIELMGVKQGATGENFTEAIRAINALASEQLPGAKVKIATATSRSVTLSEEFERPLVIGYVGFDMQILQGGRLGPPISTLSQLTALPTIQTVAGGNVYRLAALAHMHAALEGIEGDEAAGIRQRMDALDRLLPPAYPFAAYELEDADVLSEIFDAGTPIEEAGFQAVVDYLGYAQSTVDTLDPYLRDATDLGETERTALERALMAARRSIEELGSRLNEEPALLDAIDFVFIGH